MTLKESKDMIQKVLKAYETLKEHSNKEYPIKMETLPEFFGSLQLAYKALEEVTKISFAFWDMVDLGSHIYGHIDEYEMVKEWVKLDFESKEIKYEKPEPFKIDFFDLADEREGED